MIEETARVVACEDGDVWVETQRKSACGQCVANKGCGTAVIGKALGQKRARVRVRNPQQTPLRVGDEVTIGIEETVLVRGSLAIYLLPLLSFFLFGLLGKALAAQLLLGDGEGMSILFSLFGLLGGFFWARRFARGEDRLQPVILANTTPVVSFYQ